MSETFVDYTDAAMSFVTLISAAECGDVITIVRDDAPIAVIISADEFDRLTAAIEATPL